MEIRKLKEYALYLGDEFIDVGTAKEIVERNNISKSTFYNILSKRHKSEFILIELKENEE